MQQFWVVGGQYHDTNFREAVQGHESWYGPFKTYEAARQEWQRHAWNSVDDCHMRYRIERLDPEEPPRCTD